MVFGEQMPWKFREGGGQSRRAGFECFLDLNCTWKDRDPTERKGFKSSSHRDPVMILDSPSEC